MPAPSAFDTSLSASIAKPINDTPFRRFLTLFAIKLLKRVRSRSGVVLFLSDKLCVKYGGLSHLGEASAMQFVAKHTSIPVPRVYCAFEHRGRTYIVMERIHGTDVAKGWKSRSEASKAKVLGQLKRMIEELRRIPPPDGVGVESVEGGPLYDPRHPRSNWFGPFKNVLEFHRHLRSDFEAPCENYPDIEEMISLQDSGAWEPLVFTHGDLNSFNVLVSNDEVVGIIDWECAGWFPSYREYTQAWNVSPQNVFWRDEVDKFLEPMPDALRMEKIRLKYFGDV
ncbi:kinase-like protein [Sporormia fimetaria CBS 119925]|uniref:Kinase-like protein n=1 Tax=Sporormia fimetaria CBS 119925 TaxID=1340428 RepID=A0A6A6VLR8_9PLEO|nr:kinase-like protein [Sporormia fimetaria CBS 119925]